jgi:hypothetical protein
MADEITIRQKLIVSNGNLNFSRDTGEYKKSMIGSGGPSPGFLVVTTSERTINFAELGDNGMVWIENLDATNYIRWGFSTGIYGGRIEPGDTAGPFQLEPSANIFIIANTASCNVNMYCFEK